MYITNKPWVAKIAEGAGVDWIFIDMEFIGKAERQGGLDSVQNHHTVEDVKLIKNCLTTSKLLVRCNHIYDDSKAEIDAIINNGADIVMLPYFKTVNEVRLFLEYVGGRTKTCLLVETPEAGMLIDEILELPGIDMIHLGLNDMHLALGMKFMFELLADGTVDWLAQKIKAKGIPFGFGGLASLEGGAVPGSMILKEHYRLGSSMVIVSRSFCNTDIITDENEVKKIFTEGIAKIRRMEEEAYRVTHYFEDNHTAVVDAVKKIIQ